jgi:two-component system, sporulation sensor kinase E
MGEEAPLMADRRDQDVARKRGTSAPAATRPGGRVRDVAIVVGLLAVISLLHLLVPSVTPQQVALHDFFRRLYYLPILYGAYRFGKVGGLVSAAASVALYAPHAYVSLATLLGPRVDDLLEMITFVAVGGLFGQLRDVEETQTRDLLSVRAKLEDAYRILEERAMQLISIQDYTQAILRSVTSGVVTVGPDGSIATVNPAAERILGMSENDMVPGSILRMFREDGGLSGDVSKVLDGRVPRTVRDVTLVTAGNRIVHAQASVSRMRDVGGRKLGAVVTIEDVSQIKALTEQLIRADRLAAMGELTAGVAHEVRNPLGIIRASVQLMEDTRSDPARTHEAATVIKHEIDRLDKVIKALLDFGRPSAPTMMRVDVNDVLSEVVLFTRKFASRANVEIDEQLDHDVPLVTADPDQLKQVFVNLISNAVQAMEAEGGSLTVTTGTDDGFVFIRFIDDGPGIEADTLGKVFDPFYSTRDAGTGLGLTIVHRIVDEHDGHIEVASDPGEGTAFTVSLPALAL